MAAVAMLVPAASTPTGPAPAPSGHPVTTVVLRARHSRFQPGTVRVPAGATVRFVVHNDDPIDHELIVGGPGVHRRHEHGRDAHHHGDEPGEVSVPAEATAVTTFRFSRPGPVAFGCHLPGHWDYGMRGTVAVTGRR